MANKIYTQRLVLIELNALELARYVDDPENLAKQLNLNLSQDVLTDRVRRAIEIKLAKMNSADPEQHAWFTYWLMVLPEEKFCAGLIGFKGWPDENGEAEIGYGIDPAYQNKGYTTEATRAMIHWAYLEPACRSVVARDTKKANLASNRVLAKVGMYVYYESEDAFYWRIDKLPYRKEYIHADLIAHQVGSFK